MKRYLNASLFVLIAGIAGSALTACLPDSHARGNGEVSQADFDALKATVSQLQADMLVFSKSVSVVSTGPASAKNAAGALLPGDVCTYVGWLPADRPIYQANSLQCRSASGYLFALPAPDGGKPTTVDVYFENLGCVGQAYTHNSSVSEYGRLQGAVFGFGDATDRLNVGYVAPGTPISAGIMQSKFPASGTCQDVTTDYTNGGLLLVLMNDPLVTSVSSDPYPGPVVMQ